MKKDKIINKIKSILIIRLLKIEMSFISLYLSSNIKKN